MSRLIIVLVLTISVLAACAAQPQPRDCARADVFCAGLVTDYGGIDSGFAHEAWLGLQDAQAKHLVDRIDAIETVNTLDRGANIQVLADEGYDVIITIGAGMSKPTTAAAAKYRKLAFIGVEQPQAKTLPTVVGLVFHEEESGFLAGALAALMTQTGHVAAICEANYIEPMRRYCDGFAAGAHHIQPKLDVQVSYREGPGDQLFNDPDWGTKAATQALQGGADVVFAAGGQTANAALQSAAAQGAYVIGSETDLYGELTLIRPELLTCATSDVRSGILDILTETRETKLPAGEFIGAVKLAPWHNLDRQIPSSVKDQVQQIALALKLGTLETGVPYVKP